MSYTSYKERLLLTVHPHCANKEGTAGFQFKEMCFYLSKVAAIHPAVSYTALWAYLKRNYPLHTWPLESAIVYRIIYDMEMRRNQTKELQQRYVAWYKDPIMRKTMKGRCPKPYRKRVLNALDLDIKALWPSEVGKWPAFHNR